MTYQINITDQANQDLRNIFEYIAFELQEPQVAIGQLNRLLYTYRYPVSRLLPCIHTVCR